jgi:hypothetical protein
MGRIHQRNNLSIQFKLFIVAIFASIALAGWLLDKFVITLSNVNQIQIKRPI